MSHEGLPCVCFLSLFVNPAKPKLLQGFILPFHGRNNSYEGNYILHITVKNHVCFIFAREEKTTRQFSLYNCHSPEQPLKCGSFSFRRSLLFQVCFSVTFFASCVYFFFLENSFNMNFLWLFFSHLNYTKHARPER